MELWIQWCNTVPLGPPFVLDQSNKLHVKRRGLSRTFESNVSPGGAIFRHFTRDTRSTPLALLSMRRNLSSRTLSRSERKEIQPAFFSLTGWEIKFHQSRRQIGKDFGRKTKMDEVATTGEWMIFFSFFSLFLLFVSYSSCLFVCPHGNLFLSRILFRKVFTNGRR